MSPRPMNILSRFSPPEPDKEKSERAARLISELLDSRASKEVVSELLSELSLIFNQTISLTEVYAQPESESLSEFIAVRMLPDPRMFLPITEDESLALAAALLSDPVDTVNVQHYASVLDVAMLVPTGSTSDAVFHSNVETAADVISLLKKKREETIYL